MHPGLPPIDPRVKELDAQFQELKLRRSPWEPYWNDLRELVRPSAGRFGASGSFMADPEPSSMGYDSTPGWALEQLASGLHSFLTNPTERWMFLGVKADPGEETEPEVRAWLETVTDILFEVFGSSGGMFHPTLHECYLDIGCFGTAAVYEDYDPKLGMPFFQAYPLTDCWIDENELFQPDTVFRRTSFSTRQLIQKFPESIAFQPVTEAQPQKKWDVIHTVRPRAEKLRGRPGPIGKPWSSIWWCAELGQVLRESGYDVFPYHLPRWSKLSGELYGRSPGMVALPDIRMLNSMKKTLLKAAHKVVDPALMLPDDGFMLPIKTRPGGLNYYSRGLEASIDRVPGPERFDVPMEFFSATQDAILKAFYVDWLRRDPKKERQTAFEINDDRTEKLVLMAPMIGRLKNELLGPVIRTTYDLLNRWGHIPEIPEQLLNNMPVKPHYVSPAFKAQMNSKVVNAERYIQQLSQLVPVFPDILDSINPDRLGSELAILNDVTTKVLASQQEIAQKRQRRQQMEEASVQAQVAQDASGAIKNVAQARAADPTGTDNLLPFIQ